MATSQAEMTGREVLKLLQAQKEHYLRLKDVVSRQTACIEKRDVASLTTGATEVRALMRKLKDLEAALRPLRQSWGNFGIDRSPAGRLDIDVEVEEIRGLIGEIQTVKDRNATMLQASMVSVRKELGSLSARATAARAYGSPQSRPSTAPRFIDRAR